MKIRGWALVPPLFLIVLAAACAPPPVRPPAAEPARALALGWEFASAIADDPDDRAECREKIALALVASGEIEPALDRGAEIGNWRTGVVLAEAAARLAQDGQTNRALELAARAEAIGRGIQDWQRDRILARVAKSKALLGKDRDAGWTSAFYASNPEYRGETAAYHALALAREGRVTNALAVLEGLDGANHIDVSSWQAAGYVGLARAAPLAPDAMSNVLDRAWAASRSVPGLKRLDVQMELVESAAALGCRTQAWDWLQGIHSNWVNGAGPAHLKAPALAQLAVRWARLGNGEKLAECEAAAEPLIRQLQAIDQPAPFAVLGEARAAIGDHPRALAHYRLALETAGGLTNPRPRALACVEICLSLHRAGFLPQQAGEALRSLLAGFGANHG